MSDEEQLSEDEFLQREAQSAREALFRLRGETLESLARTADLGAWTEHYPLPVLGTAAVTGIAAGWAIGRKLRGGSKTETAVETSTDENGEAEASTTSTQQAAAVPPHAAATLVGGLGTLAGAFATAVVGAATEAVVGVVKDTVRESLRPEPEDAAATNGDE